MKKRILSILLALVLLCAIFPAAAFRSSAESLVGPFGDLTWTFDSSTGTLTIEGSGSMGDFESFGPNAAPWKKYDIKKAIIGNNVWNIGTDAFSNCTSLTSVTIGNRVTRISSWAFLRCTSLTSVTIPDGVLSIGDRAFYECTSLKSVTIPNTVTSIGYGSFYDCTSLKSVIIPDSMTSIPAAMFCGCTSLTSVTIPNTVTCIDESAFKECTSLTSVTIPDSVLDIDHYAFYRCASLTSVTIPKKVISVGSGSFAGCTSLRKITVASGNQRYCNDSNGVLFNKNKTVLIQCPGAFNGSYTIPNSVKEIEDWAFRGCASMTSVFIPDSVTSIGHSAFDDCSDDLVIYGVAGSKAETYAKEYGIRFVAVTAPKITTQPKSATVAIGQKATFQVVATGSLLSYQWQYKKAGESSYTNFSGATSSTLTVKGSTTNSGCKYRCVVSNPLGKMNSNSATLTVMNPPTITTQPKNATVANGDSATFSVAATGQGTLTYQWQYKRAGGTSWSNWSGRTEPTLTVTGGSNNDGCQYRCAVTNAGGTTYSNAATLTVKYPPTITTQPKDATAAIGESAVFTVAATGEGTLTYQWQYKRAGGTSWSNWSGRTEPTLTVTGGSNNNGCQYRCAVTNADGTTYSNAATLTVTSVAKPVIVTQPKSVSLAVGESMTFTCSATGEGTLTYQWQYKRAGATSWTDWSGRTDPILNVAAGSNNNGCQYRCAVTNDGGTTYSNAATLTITSSHECPGAAFTDMPAYGTIEHTAIDWAIRAGVTNGTSATTFSPNRVLTRSQVVTFLWRACGSPEPKTTQNPFTDVKTSDWFYKAVLWAVEEGITTGTSSTKFSPNLTCSRSQTLTFLYRQQGSPAVGSVTVPYTDVQSGAFYENAMKWAYANGIDKGVTKTTFCPNADCTRVSTVVFLYRAISGQGRLK